MDSTRRVARPNYSSDQVEHNHDSPISEIKEGDLFEEFEEQTLPQETRDKPPRP